MFEALLGLINCGGNVAVAVCLYYLYAELHALRKEMSAYRTKEECTERHGRSCERLDNLETKVDSNTFSIAELKGKVNK